MSSQPPTPPSTLSTSLINELAECSVQELNDAAEYANELAEHLKEESRGAGRDESEERERPEADDLPDDVPSKATITVKEINDNRYYYWQWREGEQIKSKYKGPVNPSE